MNLTFSISLVQCPLCNGYLACLEKILCYFLSYIYLLYIKEKKYSTHVLSFYCIDIMFHIYILNIYSEYNNKMNYRKDIYIKRKYVIKHLVDTCLIQHPAGRHLFYTTCFIQHPVGRHLFYTTPCW